jgi:enhancing lycopene biosynthesis protein 2
MTKVAVVLSGCGHKDGAEIREAVLTLFYLDEAGCEVRCFAPDQPQVDVVNHVTGKPAGESRNVLTESARIARGDISPLSQANAAEFDALVMPGGFGAAKNLSDFAVKGKNCGVNPDLKKLILDFHADQKPIGAICIAPAVLAAALAGKVKAKLTIGDDKDVGGAIEAMGHIHVNCPTDSCVTDEAQLLASCSAYMRNDRLSLIAKGIEKCVGDVVRMAKARAKKAA